MSIRPTTSGRESHQTRRDRNSGSSRTPRTELDWAPTVGNNSATTTESEPPPAARAVACDTTEDRAATTLRGCPSARSRGRPRSQTGPMPMPMPLMRKRKRKRWLRTEPEEKIMLRKPRRARTTTTETLAPLTWLGDDDDDDKSKIKNKRRRGGTVALIREHRARPAGRSGGRFQWSRFLVAGPLFGTEDDDGSCCCCCCCCLELYVGTSVGGGAGAGRMTKSTGAGMADAGPAKHHLVDEIHVHENRAGDADGTSSPRGRPCPRGRHRRARFWHVRRCSNGCR
jgi:hypothetical protein